MFAWAVALGSKGSLVVTGAAWAVIVAVWDVIAFVWDVLGAAWAVTASM